MTRPGPSPAGIPLPAGDGTPLVGELLEELNTVGPSGLMQAVLASFGVGSAVRAVRLLIVDLEEAHLEARTILAAGAVRQDESIPLEGTAHGEAYRSGTIQVLGDTVLAPVRARTNPEGVLEAHLSRPATKDEVALIGSLAIQMGYLINAADRWTDVFHVVRRSRPMSLAAEIQWGSLPLSTFSSADVSLAGALEPAYDVGGDAFDYACGTEELFAGVFDAMGHGLHAARLSAFALAAYRNARRGGADLDSQGSALHSALTGPFAHEGYVTGTLVQIDLGSPSRSRIVRAGHPAPLLHRGVGAPEPVTVEGGLPFGVPFDNRLLSHPLDLASGDRLVLYSDGLVEARPEKGEAFGVPMLQTALQDVRGVPPREAGRRVIRSVCRHRAQELADDATILVVDIP